MERLKKDDLLSIEGGGISGTLISAFTKCISTVYDIGRSLGSAIRRIGSNNLCPM